MADIAELGYKIDSSGLVAGTKALDDNAAAATRTSAAAERLEKEYQSAMASIQASTGMSVTELQALNKTQNDMLAVMIRMADRMDGVTSASTAAAMAIKSVSEASRNAADDLAVQAETAAQAELRYKAIAQAAIEYRAAISAENQANTTPLLPPALSKEDWASVISYQKKVRQEMQDLALAEAEAGKAAEGQSIDVGKLLGQIDPLLKKLDQLDDLENQLAEARKLKLLDAETFDEYSAKIKTMRTDTIAASEAMGKLNLNSIQTKTNMYQFFEYLAMGDFTMASRQILQLGNGVGGLGNLFSEAGAMVKGFGAMALEVLTPVTLGVGAAAAVVGTLGYAWYDAEQRAKGFKKAADEINSWGGNTSAALQSVATDVSNVAFVSLDTAAKITDAVASTGKFTIDQTNAISIAIASAAGNNEDMAKSMLATYRDIARDPVDALAKLVDAHTDLSAAQIQLVIDLDKSGDKVAAISAATKDYTDYLEKHADAGRSFWSYLKEIPDDVAKAIDALKEQQTAAGIAEQLQNMRDNDPNATSGGYYKKQQDRLSAILNSQTQDAVNKAMAFTAGGASALVTGDDVKNVAKIADEVKNWSESSATLAGKIQKIKDQWDPLIKSARLVGDNGAVTRAMQTMQAQIDKATADANTKAAKLTRAADRPANTLIDDIERQITANKQLAEAGEKVTASDSLAIKAKQLLSDKTNTMTASTRSLLQALLPTLATTDAQAKAEQQRQRGLAETAALQDRLAQLEKQRNEQNSIDLMGINTGSDAQQMLQRQLNIQKQYLDEKEKLDKAQRNKNTALSQADYDNDVAMLQASLDRSLDAERAYQEQRQALQADWHNGAYKAFGDYAAQAQNVAGLANTAFTDAFSGMEDSIVNFVKTGKLSFTDLANSIITDLTRIYAKQLITGLLGNLFSGSGGPVQAESIAQYNPGVTVNAKGNVYDSANLSAYSNQIVSTPTMFKFANGAGLMGEAGDEAIMPLKRGSDGRLGVSAANAGTNSAPPVINVTIEKGADRDDVQQASGTGGQINLRVMVKDTVNSLMQTGAFDRTLSQRTGTRYAGVSRG